MKLLLLSLLYVSISFSAEPPPSPRQDLQEAFKQRLRAQKAAQQQRIDDLIADRAEQRMHARLQEYFEEGLLPPCTYHKSIEIQPLPEWLEKATNEAIERTRKLNPAQDQNNSVHK